MNLSTTTVVPAVPAFTESTGTQSETLGFPSALKIQTTGPDAAEWLTAQCPQGKTWRVTVWVRVEEKNA